MDELEVTKEETLRLLKKLGWGKSRKGNIINYHAVYIFIEVELYFKYKGNEHFASCHLIK